jgi:hypothetical protein
MTHRWKLAEEFWENIAFLMWMPAPFHLVPFLLPDQNVNIMPVVQKSSYSHFVTMPLKNYMLRLVEPSGNRSLVS